MTSRRTLAAAWGLVVILLVVLAAILIAHHGDGVPAADGAAAPTTWRAPATPPPTPAPTIPAPTIDATEARSWEATSDRATSLEDDYAQLNDPRRSDLAPGLAAETAQRARVFETAELTGAGRHLFPGYWSSGGAQGDRGPCCRNLVIHAAGAASVPGRTDLVRVAVVWAADDLNGAHLEGQTTVVYLAERAGRWEPLHPSETHP